MRTILVKDLYRVDTISRQNNEAWRILMEKLNSIDKDSGVLFDFKGIDVIEPWLNDMFKKLIRDERVHMKLYSSEVTVNTINMACKLGGMKGGRVVNENVTSNRISVKDRVVLKEIKDIVKYFRSDEGVEVLEIYKKYSQLGAINTIPLLNNAIRFHVNNTGIRNIIIDTGGIDVSLNIVELLIDMIINMRSDGIAMDIVSKNKDVVSRIELYKHLEYSKDMSVKDKYSAVNRVLSIKTVGMLMRYKKSKAVDRFGRYGKGEPVSCRVAIYNGMEIGDAGIKLKFKTFNGDRFYTHEHWALENDGEELEKLIENDVEVPIDEVGILDEFLGSKYHFMLPIQCNKEDSTVMYVVNDEGGVTHIEAIIPVRIKMVLDDWGIEYNKDKLDRVIEETKKILGRIEEEEAKE